MTRDYTATERRNREVVLDFYTHAILNWDFDAAAHHLGATYRQHNPNVAEGADGFREFISHVRDHFGRPESDIIRVIVDDNMVVLHIRSKPSPDRQLAIMDMFRLEDGKIVEHWDVIQPVPPESKHANTMF